MEDTVLKAALAGLLHDVGKFAQRAGAGLGDAGDNQTQGVSSYQLAANGFIEKYVPEIWWDSIGEADRLVQAAPASRTLLARAAERGANLGGITAALMRLLAQTGAADLQAAILEALERGVPHPNAVRLALARQREQRGEAPSIGVVLPAHVQARDAPVQPHALESYDQLKECSDVPPADADD